MPKPLSMDLGERIMDACDAGESVHDVAQRFDVSKRTIYNWLALRRETGELTPRQGDVGRKSKLDDRRTEIEQAIDENSSLTLAGLIAQLSLSISQSALWQTLNRWGITWKKSHARRGAAAT
ncbi:MAG: IS630 transposase-related protein [Planctomycetaceae bacterium]